MPLDCRHWSFGTRCVLSNYLSKSPFFPTNLLPYLLFSLSPLPSPKKTPLPQAHFGKFASHYLKREFYFDVHPPLGKMLVAFVGLLSGFDGNYEFKSGETYPDSVPYQAMRVWLSMFGAAMVPLAWYTATELHFSMRSRHLVTLMVLFGKFVSLSLLEKGICIIEPRPYLPRRAQTTPGSPSADSSFSIHYYCSLLALQSTVSLFSTTNNIGMYYFFSFSES